MSDRAESIATGCRYGCATLAIGLLLASSCSAADTAHSHCSATEQTLFTCSTGRKIVSVCATADLSPDAGSVQYRFGPAAAPELAYPRAGADWRKLTRGGVLTFAGGGGAYLAFSNAPFRYVVYTAVGRGWGEKAGVVVEKHGKRVASWRCTGKETSEIGPDLFAKSGIVKESGGFDVP